MCLCFALGCLLIWEGEGFSRLHSLASTRVQKGIITYTGSAGGNESFRNTRLAANEEERYSDLLSAYGAKKKASPDSLPSFEMPSSDVDASLKSNDVLQSSIDEPISTMDTSIPSEHVKDAATKAEPLFQKFKAVESVKVSPSGEKAPGMFDYLSSKYSETEKFPFSEKSESASNWISGYKPNVPESEGAGSVKNIADYIGIKAPQFKEKIPTSTEKAPSFSNYLVDKIDAKLPDIDGSSEKVQNIADYASAIKIKAIEKSPSTEKAQNFADYLSFKTSEFKDSGGFESIKSKVTESTEKVQDLTSYLSSKTFEFRDSEGFENIKVKATESSEKVQDIANYLSSKNFELKDSGFENIRVQATESTAKVQSFADYLSTKGSDFQISGVLEENIALLKDNAVNFAATTSAVFDGVQLAEIKNKLVVWATEIGAASNWEELSKQLRVDEYGVYYAAFLFTIATSSFANRDEDSATELSSNFETGESKELDKNTVKRTEVGIEKLSEISQEISSLGNAALEASLEEEATAAERAKVEMEKVFEEKASLEAVTADMETKMEEGKKAIEEAKSNMEVAIENEKLQIEEKKAEMVKIVEESAALEKTKLEIIDATQKIRTEMMKEVETISEEKAMLNKAKSKFEAAIAQERVAAEKAKVEMEDLVKQRTFYEKARTEMEVEIEKNEETIKALKLEKTMAEEALKKDFFAMTKKENEMMLSETAFFVDPTTTERATDKVLKTKVFKEKVSNSPRGVKGLSRSGEIDEFASLTPAALKRKTVKELASFLSKRGVAITDENGKTLKKAALLEAVNKNL